MALFSLFYLQMYPGWQVDQLFWESEKTDGKRKSLCTLWARARRTWYQFSDWDWRVSERTSCRGARPEIHYVLARLLGYQKTIRIWRRTREKFLVCGTRGWVCLSKSCWGISTLPRVKTDVFRAFNQHVTLEWSSYRYWPVVWRNNRSGTFPRPAFIYHKMNTGDSI